MYLRVRKYIPLGVQLYNCTPVLYETRNPGESRNPNPGIPGIPESRNRNPGNRGKPGNKLNKNTHLNV